MRRLLAHKLLKTAPGRFAPLQRGKYTLRREKTMIGEYARLHNNDFNCLTNFYDDEFRSYAILDRLCSSSTSEPPFLSFKTDLADWPKLCWVLMTDQANPNVTKLHNAQRRTRRRWPKHYQCIATAIRFPTKSLAQYGPHGPPK